MGIINVLVVICIIGFCIWVFKNPLMSVAEWVYDQYLKTKKDKDYYAMPSETGHYLFGSRDEGEFQWD